MVTAATAIGTSDGQPDNPAHGHLRPAAGHLRPGRRAACLWDDAGREYLDFLCGLAVTSLGHAHPAVADAVCAQARTLLHVSNLFGTEPAAPRWRPPSTASSTPARAGSSSATAGPRPTSAPSSWPASGAAGARHVRRQRLRLVPRPHPGHPARHRAAGQARAVPAAARGVPPRRLAGRRRPGRRHRPVAWPPCCSSRCRGRAGSTRRRRVLPGGPPALRRAGRAADRRRGADRPRAAPASGSGSSTTAIRPDVVTMAKALGNGVPIGACWARDDVAAAFVPGRPRHHVRRPAAGNRGGPGRAGGDGGRGRPGPGPEAGARPDRRARASCRASAAVRGLGLLVAAELEEGKGAGPVAAAALDAGLVVNAVTPTALRLAPSLLVSEEEIDEAVAILAAPSP